MDRQFQLISQVGAGAEGYDMAAGLQKFFQLRDRVLRRDASQVRAIFDGDAVGIRLRSVAPGRLARLGDRRYGAVYEDDHVIFRPEVAGIDVAAVDDSDGEMVLFRNPPDPAGGHGSAIDVPECDAGSGNFDRVRGTVTGDIEIAV